MIILIRSAAVVNEGKIVSSDVLTDKRRIRG